MGRWTRLLLAALLTGALATWCVLAHEGRPVPITANRSGASATISPNTGNKPRLLGAAADTKNNVEDPFSVYRGKRWRAVDVEVVFDAPHSRSDEPRTARLRLGPAGRRHRELEVRKDDVEDGTTVRIVAQFLGPAQLSGHTAGWVLANGPIDVPLRVERVQARFVEACSLKLEIFDASTTLPVQGDLTAVAAHRTPDGKTHRARSAPNLSVYPWMKGLRPGKHRVSVAVPGYAPWEMDVLLSQPGASRQVTARLWPASDWGWLALDLNPPPGGTLEAAHIHLEVQKIATGQVEAYHTPTLRTIDPETHVVTLPLPPGEHRLIAWAGRNLVGGLSDVSVLAGERIEKSLHLGPGLLLPLKDLPWKATFYSDSRVVGVMTPDGRSLPVVWFPTRTPPRSRHVWLTSRHDGWDERARSSSHTPAKTRGGRWDLCSVDYQAVLGPYPWRALTVREQDGAGWREHLFERR